jgi:hypothetical protein
MFKINWNALILLRGESSNKPRKEIPATVRISNEVCSEPNKGDKFLFADLSISVLVIGVEYSGDHTRVDFRHGDFSIHAQILNELQSQHKIHTLKMDSRHENTSPLSRKPLFLLR